MSTQINRNKVADELGRRISASTSPFHTVLYATEFFVYAFREGIKRSPFVQ